MQAHKYTFYAVTAALLRVRRHGYLENYPNIFMPLTITSSAEVFKVDVSQNGL
jgi:hypothetical protein